MIITIDGSEDSGKSVIASIIQMALVDLNFNTEIHGMDSKSHISGDFIESAISKFRVDYKDQSIQILVK